MKHFLAIPLLALTATAAPLVERQDQTWQVTEFSSSVAPHSISQITRFSVTVPSTNVTVLCSDGRGALLSSEPALDPVINAPCVAGSGFNFTLQQIADFAIELSVQNPAGLVATYTSGTDEVSVISTGPTPLDTETAYTGPSSFDLVVAS